MKKRIDLVIIDDDEKYIKYMKILFEKKLDIKVKSISSVAKAIKFIEINNPKVALVDIFFKNSNIYDNGLEIIEKLSPIVDTDFIVMTGEKSVDNIFRAGQLAVKGIIDKSLGLTELIKIVKNLLEKQKKFDFLQDNLPAFIGISDSIKNIHDQIKIASESNLPILITGETGVGKDVVARLIHLTGNRKDRNLRVFDSGRLQPELAASELFGHVKGAFTGADTDKDGIFKESDKGTLFIDEIGNMSHDIQQKMLRALNKPQRILPIGHSKEEYEVDVRIICATNKNLLDLIKDNLFREDIYARIDNPLRINIPPLRKRREDILPLFEYFAKCRERNNQSIAKFDDEAMNFLINIYQWPRNVRQLDLFFGGMSDCYGHKGIINKKTTIDKLILQDTERKKYEEEISKKTYKSDLDSIDNENDIIIRIKEGSNLKESKKVIEKTLILNSLKKSKGNVKEAAKQLGITREHLHRIKKKHSIG